MSEPKQQDKPFQISKWVVWEAFQRVKANKGAAGVDEQSIEEFEQERDANLYRIWNRLSSGSYFPPPVKAVEIPKAGGKGVRVLGVPTVADRVAQTAARICLEPNVEPVFHPDSYGYRPKRSALDAVSACRQRCWRSDWVIDLDIRAFFDTVPHDLVLKAVAHHTDQRWILLYVQRWLQAPLQQRDGTLVALLQVPVALLPAAAQPALGAVGLPQVQTATTSGTTCDGLAGRDRPAFSPAVRALAARCPS